MPFFAFKNHCLGKYFESTIDNLPTTRVSLMNGLGRFFLFFVTYVCLSFSAQAQTQQWNHYWLFYNPGTWDFRLITPVGNISDEQYMQQALKALMGGRGAESCESIYVSYNDTSTGNVSGPVISKTTNAT